MILAILNIILCINSISCLRWAPFNDNKTSESPIFISLTVGYFTVNVYKGDQIIINRNLYKENTEFGVYCLVSGLNPKSSMVYKFCQDKFCKEWKELDYDTVFLVASFKILRLPNPENVKGLVLKVVFIQGGNDFSKNFHCEAEDTVGKFTITSNDIQIRDTVEWSKYYVTNKENTIKPATPAVTRDSLPITLKCAQDKLTANLSRPIWFDQLAVSPVDWSVCPVKNNYITLTAREKATFKNCVKFTTAVASGEIDELIKPKNIVSMMNQWNYFIDTNGDLQIFQIPADDNAPSLSYALMCFRKTEVAEPITTYVSAVGNEDNKDDIVTGVEFIGKPPTFKRKLEAISPIIQNVSLFIRKVEKGYVPKPVALLALYRASSDLKPVWKFNGQQLFRSNNIEVNDYSVQFIGEIGPKDAGTYTAEISDGATQLLMTIYAVVLGPPTLDNTNCLPLVAYVHDSESKTFICTFRSMPESLMLKINSIEIPLGQPLDTSRINLGKTYPFLGELNFTVSPVGYTSSEMVTMTYTVTNLRKTQGQTVYQDHNVMFMVTNKYGSIARSSSIYVVPKLKENIQSSPEAYNCTDVCSSEMSHKFQCKISLDSYDNRELIIEHYWTINNHKLGDKNGPKNLFTNYFTVDPITKELVLLPVRSNNTEEVKNVKAALMDNNIECHFNLFSPPEVIPPFIYLSTSDASLGTMMKARIRLDNMPINTAYIYWIVAVILALIIILLMIILLTRYCMRNKGETYQLDKIERQHGYDPEKEVQEEMFKPYEREEHDPDVMSGGTDDRKLSITGHSVGSADDGELDTYDIDPSNFNEDGSIIGKYGANPRSRAAMT